MSQEITVRFGGASVLVQTGPNGAAQTAATQAAASEAAAQAAAEDAAEIVEQTALAIASAGETPSSRATFDLPGPAIWAPDRLVSALRLDGGGFSLRSLLFNSSGVQVQSGNIAVARGAGADLVASGTVSHPIVGYTNFAAHGALRVTAGAALRLKAGDAYDLLVGAEKVAFGVQAAIPSSAVATRHLFRAYNAGGTVEMWLPLNNNTQWHLKKTDGVDEVEWQIVSPITHNSANDALILLLWDGSKPIADGRVRVLFNGVDGVVTVLGADVGYDPTELVETGDTIELGSTAGTVTQMDLLTLGIWTDFASYEPALFWEAAQQAQASPTAQFTRFNLIGTGGFSHTSPEWRDRPYVRSATPTADPDPVITLDDGDFTPIACPTTPNVLSLQAAGGFDRETSQVGWAIEMSVCRHWLYPDDPTKRLAFVSGGPLAYDVDGFTTGAELYGQVWQSTDGGDTPFTPVALANPVFTFSGTIPVTDPGAVNNIFAPVNSSVSSVVHKREPDDYWVIDGRGYHGAVGARVKVTAHYVAAMQNYSGGSQGQVWISDNPLDARAWYRLDPVVGVLGYHAGNGNMGSATGGSPYLMRLANAIMEFKGLFFDEGTGRWVSLLRTNGPRWLTKPQSNTSSQRSHWTVLGVPGREGLRAFDVSTALPAGFSVDLLGQYYKMHLFELGQGMVGMIGSGEYQDLDLGTTGDPPTINVPAGDPLPGYLGSRPHFQRWNEGECGNADPEFVSPNLVDNQDAGTLFFHDADYDYENEWLYLAVNPNGHGALAFGAVPGGTKDGVKYEYDIVKVTVPAATLRAGRAVMAVEPADEKVLRRTLLPFWGGNIRWWRLSAVADDFGSIRARLIYARAFDKDGTKRSPEGFGFQGSSVDSNDGRLLWQTNDASLVGMFSPPDDMFYLEIETDSGAAPVLYNGVYANYRIDRWA